MRELNQSANMNHGRIMINKPIMNQMMSFLLVFFLLCAVSSDITKWDCTF